MKVYQGDIGTEIVIDLGESLSGGTVYKMKVRKPSGTEAEWTASVTESTKITYTTVSGDLDEYGRYLIQPYVELENFQGYGETVVLEVHRPYAV